MVCQIPKKVRRAAANIMTNKSKNASVETKTNVKTVSINEKPNKESIKDIKKKLDDQIKTFQNKSKLIADRDKFLESQTEILNYIKDQAVDYDPSMDSRRMTLILRDNQKYRSESVVQISNNEIIKDMMLIIMTKITAKITEIEKEILS